MDIHPSAHKHGIVDEDIEQATAHAMAIEDQDDDTRLYLGRPETPICWKSSRSCGTTTPNLRSTQ